jgi:hypothetical protein
MVLLCGLALGQDAPPGSHPGSPQYNLIGFSNLMGNSPSPLGVPNSHQTQFRSFFSADARIIKDVKVSPEYPDFDVVS